ncbi:MAG: hypothetical protein ACO1N9_01600 [Flavobacterium sp.]
MNIANSDTQSNATPSNTDLSDGALIRWKASVIMKKNISAARTSAMAA